MEVTLTDAEIADAVRMGHRRQSESEKAGRKAGFAEDRPGHSLRSNHTSGAIAEYAFAKLVGIEPDLTINGFGKPDFAFGGRDYQIRWSNYPTLKIRHDDKDHWYAVAMTGNPPTLRCAGWILTECGRQDRWLKDPGQRKKPAFFVPWQVLMPLHTLIPECEEQ